MWVHVNMWLYTICHTIVSDITVLTVRTGEGDDEDDEDDDD